MNMFSFSVQKRDGQAILERDGFFHVDDVVNVFIPGSPSPPLGKLRLLKANRIINDR